MHEKTLMEGGDRGGRGERGRREGERVLTYNEVVLKHIETFKFDMRRVWNELVPRCIACRVYVVVCDLEKPVVLGILVGEYQETRILMCDTILYDSREERTKCEDDTLFQCRTHYDQSNQ
jgi:hypothetical protein